jgi:hypothetical protein
VGISEADVIRIYQGHGFMSLPLSGISLKPYHPDPKYQTLLDPQPEYCNGSVDTYRFTYEALQAFLAENVGRIFNDSTKTIDNLTENEKIDLSIGFQSDFNGWVNHSRPRYGKQGCFEAAPGAVYEPIELQGLAHPGLLESQWRWMAKEDVDLEPILRASEKFLRVWEYFYCAQGRVLIFIIVRLSKVGEMFQYKLILMCQQDATNQFIERAIENWFRITRAMHNH